MAGQTNAGDDLKKFLDANQYSRKSILRYERIFGPTYISTGGEETTVESVKSQSIVQNQSITIHQLAFNTINFLGN